MPEAIEPQLDELRRRARRRLVGAVVLALAAAVLVPMLLESDPKPLGEDVSVKIPPIDDGKFVNKVGEKGRAVESPAPAKAAQGMSKAPTDITTVPPAAKEPTAALPSAAPAKSVNESESRTGAPAGKAATNDATSAGPTGQKAGVPNDASKTAAAPVIAPKAAPDASPSADAPKMATKQAGGPFSVQLAAFSDDKGANALATRLKKNGHPAYIEPYATSRGALWRVRVGPYASRDAAEAARGKLKAEGQSGIIAAAN